MQQREELTRRKCAMKTDDIPDSDDNDDIIRNQDTLKRRAWVDRAIEGVRRRLEQGDGVPADSIACEPDRPRLSVVPPSRKR
jgi:hypothetical protein